MYSVAELPLFWAVPAPDIRGSGADSGSRQKKNRLRLQAKKSGTRRLLLLTRNFFMSALKYVTINKNHFSSCFLLILNWLHDYILKKQDFFSFLKDPAGAGAAIKSSSGSGSDLPKNRLRLRNTGFVPCSLHLWKKGPKGLSLLEALSFQSRKTRVFFCSRVENVWGCFI